MQKYNQKVDLHKRPPVIDLSSDEDSDSQSQKQNSYAYSYNAVDAHPHRSVQVLQSSQYQNNHMISNLTEGITKPNQQLQFSTLNLDQNSILEHEHLIRSNNNDRGIIHENEELKRLNWQLQRQILELKQTIQTDRQQERQYQHKLEQYQLEIEQAKSKNRKIQTQLLKLQKQFENKLINQELPNRKTNAEELNKTYTEIMNKIKIVIQKYLTELAKEKMNVKVQAIITDLVNEIVQVNPRTNVTSNEALNDFSSLQSNGSHHAYRSQRSNKFMSGPSEHSPIGEQYRLLQKSIDKLKNMQKQINQKTGSFLKKQFIEESSVNKSGIGLDQSTISILDRSKSRRKRIFQ